MRPGESGKSLEIDKKKDVRGSCHIEILYLACTKYLHFVKEMGI